MNISNSADSNLLKYINTYGWGVIKVGDPDQEQPNFAYSVGVWHSFKQPEIIMLGLDLNTMHVVINDIVESMNNGKVIVPGQLYPDFLQDYDCVFREVTDENREEYFVRAQWFYESIDFPALQCFWPDNNRRYPWDNDYDKELFGCQPLLFKA